MDKIFLVGLAIMTVYTVQGIPALIERAMTPKASFAQVSAPLNRAESASLYDACMAPARWADYEREAGLDAESCARFKSDDIS